MIAKHHANHWTRLLTQRSPAISMKQKIRAWVDDPTKCGGRLELGNQPVPERQLWVVAVRHLRLFRLSGKVPRPTHYGAQDKSDLCEELDEWSLSLSFQWQKKVIDQSEGRLAGLEKKDDWLEGHVGPMNQVAEGAEATNCRWPHRRQAIKKGNRRKHARWCTKSNTKMNPGCWRMSNRNVESIVHHSNWMGRLENEKRDHDEQHCGWQNLLVNHAQRKGNWFWNHVDTCEGKSASHENCAWISTSDGGSWGVVDKKPEFWTSTDKNLRNCRWTLIRKVRMWWGWFRVMEIFLRDWRTVTSLPLLELHQDGRDALQTRWYPHGSRCTTSWRLSRISGGMSKAAGDEFAMNSVAQTSCWDWRRSLWKAMNQRKKLLEQKFKDTTKLFEPNLKWEV